MPGMSPTNRRPRRTPVGAAPLKALPHAPLSGDSRVRFASQWASITLHKPAAIGEEVGIHIPYFFSDVFDLSYALWGDTTDPDQVVYRGELESNSFSVWWLRQSSVVAAFVMGRPEDEREIAPQWIESRQRVPQPDSAMRRYPCRRLLKDSAHCGPAVARLHKI